jgi:hypothetical protein
MIDRHSRDILAEQFRHLLSGQITNDQFEDRLRQSKDVGVKEVFFCGAWPLYDDLHEHKLIGKWAIKREHMPIAARYLLFLKTDLEYEWPRRTGLAQLPGCIFSVLTFGAFGNLLNGIRNKRKRGDTDVWPFFRKSDYDKALEQHPYLKKQWNTEPAPPPYSSPAAGSESGEA